MNGYRAAEAKDGREVLDRAVELSPDLILMDMSMPHVDGWEATRLLKADVRTQHIPVVAVTGHALPGHADRAREVGCDVVIVKPCLPPELVSAIARVLGRSEAKQP